MKNRAHFLWLIYTMRDKCHDLAAERICAGIDSGSLEQNLAYFSDIKTYCQLTNYIFDVKTESPIDVLHKYGYYRYGDASIFKKQNLDEISLINLIECYMWASLDRKIPTNTLVRKVGRIKIFSLSDPEAILCSWINSCCLQYTKLRPITSITQNFIGSYHFRALLYSYVRDESLLKYADPRTNAQVSLKVCESCGIHLLFDAHSFLQSPLVIMCFLVDTINILDTVKPMPGPRAVSRMDMQRIEKNIAETKREVEQIKSRCNILSNDVNLIAARLLKMKRPATSIAGVKSRPQLPVQMEFPDQPGLPPINTSNKGGQDDRPRSALHVKWEIPPEMMSNRSVPLSAKD